MPRRPTEKGERKIEKSQKGRVYWKPGQKHPLDVLQKELDELKSQLPGLIDELLATAQETTVQLGKLQEVANASDDLSVLFGVSDHKAHMAIYDRFKNRKHEHHLQLAFAIQRHKRLLGRLRTIQAALQLSNNLLATEETLSQEFMESWQASQQGQPQQDEELTEEKPPMSTEEERVQGIKEPITNIVSSVDQSRELLRQFEASLPDLRRRLSTGTGWFEIFSVPKRNYSNKVIAYIKALKAWRKKQIPIPPEIDQALSAKAKRFIEAGVSDFPKELHEEVYVTIYVGPYVKYRWTEEKRTYTISLGLLEDYPPYPFTPEGF